MEIYYKIETHCFGPYKIKIKRVQNLDDLIGQVSDDEFNRDERLPYWAELWPSAIGLSLFLVSSPELIEKKSILELGVGLGLTSIIIHKLKPYKVLLTDYETDALQIVEENFSLNDLPKPNVQLLDWRKPHLTQSFDCIVASDILYEERFFGPLILLFKTFLKPNGKIIIAEPNRAVARPFFTLLQSHGFEWQSSTLMVHNNPKPIRVTNYIIYKQSAIC